MQPKTIGKRPRKDALHVDSVEVRWDADEPDEDTNDPQQHCYAVAQVSYALADGVRRLEWFASGGLGGIQVAGPDDPYRQEIADEQIDDLRAHLTHFGITFSDGDWRRLVSTTDK